MAVTQAEFLDGPRKGNPLKVPDHALNKEITVAYKKDDGSIGIAIYQKQTKKSPAGCIITTNEYKYVGDKQRREH